MLNVNKILKIAVIWFFINTVIAVIIYSLLYFSFSPGISFGDKWILFCEVIITCQTVGYFCAATGYSLGALLKNKPVTIQFVMIITACLFSALIANGTSFLIVRLIFDPGKTSSIDHFFNKSLAIMLIAATATTITVIIERMKSAKQDSEKNLKEFSELSSINSIPVKEDETYYVIKYDDLVYISSHGKKTTLHTIEKDYTINRLLKDIEGKLSDKFIRIHKQFIINTEYLSQIKYFEGGRYLAYLKDEDESTLPVGRKIAPLLKEKLGI